MQVLCRKGKARRWEYVGGELFAGLGLIAMVLVGSLLPLDVTLFYIRLIFWGIGVGFACLLAAVGVAHLRFERLPDCLLVLKDCKTLQDFYNDRIVSIAEIREVRIRYGKDKYGRQYSYGVITLITDQEQIAIRHATDLEEAKQTIDDWIKRPEENNGRSD